MALGHWVLALCEEMNNEASSIHLVVTPSNMEFQICFSVGRKLHINKDEPY